MRKILALCLGLFPLWMAAAYNPPFGAESYTFLGQQALQAGAASPAGSGVFSTGPWSVQLNPALTGGNQRFSLDAGYTALIDSSGGTQMGSGALLGFLAPSRWGVFSLSVQGLFNTPDSLSMDNSLNFRAGFARDISDSFYTGLSVFCGFPAAGGDFAAAFDLGVFFRLNDILFLKQPRAGFVLANIGKTLTAVYDANGRGIYGADETGHYPGLLTPKAGFAATLFQNAAAEIGFSAGLAFPSFQNLVAEAGVEARLGGPFTLSAGYQVNLREQDAGFSPQLPFLTLKYTFAANTGKAGFLADRGWQQSDFTAAALWRNIGNDLTLLSLGGSANFGARDEDGPEITIWGEK
jgi:hypothetical protein